MNLAMYIYIYTYFTTQNYRYTTCIYRLVPAPGTTYDGGGGVGC